MTHLIWKGAGSVACGRRIRGCDIVMTADPDQVTCRKCKGTLRFFCAVTLMSYADAHDYIGAESTKTALAKWRRAKAGVKDTMITMGTETGRFSTSKLNESARPRDVNPTISDVTFDGESDTFQRFTRGMTTW